MGEYKLPDDWFLAWIRRLDAPINDGLKDECKRPFQFRVQGSFKKRRRGGLGLSKAASRLRAIEKVGDNGTHPAREVVFVIPVLS